MIVYSGTKSTFQRDVMNGVIATKIDKLFEQHFIPHAQQAEMRSWENSLPRISTIINDQRIPEESQVAIEYQIPLTAKRVDFMIGGKSNNKENIVVMELKQWETCEPTSRENVVNAFTGGANRDVAHPSQQVYSYVKLIENFNEAVRENDITLRPCAYLHNYKRKNRGKICHEVYSEIIKEAPVFLQEDSEDLQNYIAEYVNQPSNKKLFEIIEYGKIKPSKSLQDSVGEILNGNMDFEMIDEQQVAYATILKLVQNTINKDEKHTIIVQGGPGTGKSVIAINLLAKILNNGFSCFYVTKTSAPRATFSKSLVRGKYKMSYLKGLFKSSGSFKETPSNTFDCLLVDEAHRLNEKSGMYHNQGENQIKEIINASKISVFFIDEDQVISTSDIGSVGEIKKWAKLYGSKIHCDKSLNLVSQFRCNGSDGYLAFLDDVLQIRPTANYCFEMDYDLKFFDSPTIMREALREKNKNNKARMIAGYCYSWISKNDKTKMDIILEDDFEAQWNFTTDSFATDEGSFEQVGCIHSTQGLEFEYVGIIIGNDLRYENGEVVADFTRRDRRDATIKGIKTSKNYALADRIVRNTYKTLLSRGQKGCYIYCENKALGEYLASRCNKTFTQADVDAEINPAMKVLNETENAENDIPMITVKCLNYQMVAGFKITDSGNQYDLIELPESDVEFGTDFVTLINEQSMEPEIYSGEYVCVNIDRGNKLSNGTIGIFVVDGILCCRRFFRAANGDTWLVVEDEKLKDSNIHISGSDNLEYQCCGVVLGHNKHMPKYFIAK